MSHLQSNHNHSVSNLKLAFWLNITFALVEIVGGILTNSLAILSDAFHDMGDSVALGLAWYFQRISGKNRDHSYTYGYKRYSLLGATFSALILLLGSVFIISQSIPRLMHPEMVHSQGMMYLAITGIIVNGFAMLRLKQGHSHNEKIISIHLLEDVLGWMAVLIGSIVMKFTDLPIIDPILSLVITAFILYRAFTSLKQVFRIFMQATPSSDQIELIKRQLLTIKGVSEVHDIHLWTLDGTYHIASIHACVNPDITIQDSDIIRQELRNKLKMEGFKHSTIELEPDGHKCPLHDC